MTDSAGDTPQDFRHDTLASAALAVVTVMFAMLSVLFAGMAAALLADGFWGTCLGFIAAAGLSLLLARVTLREFFFRLRWRVRLGPDAAWLDLPASRLLFGNEQALSGQLPYAGITQVEWREEAVRSFGMAAVNRVYAVRLKSGGLILIGEDRPTGREGQYMTRTGSAARALAKQAGVRLIQLPMAEGKGGVLTLIGTSRPAWPDRSEAPALSAADESAIRRSLLITQLLPLIAFAVMIAGQLLGRGSP
ncbi:MAG: hypothetical protein ACK4HR_08965 [Hyphomonas sp.]|jgi:hypothetical protein